MKKFFVVTSLCVMMFSVAGCSPSSVESAPYTDANVDVMKQDIRDTVCSVSGKRVMSKEDVERFFDLSDRLDEYEGELEEKVDKVSVMIKSVAATWGNTLGLDLGEKNATELTGLCNLVKSSV